MIALGNGEGESEYCDKVNGAEGSKKLNEACPVKKLNIWVPNRAV
jgi:hypothetical protein